MPSLSGSANLIKYLLFIFNFLFVITGIIILSIGLSVQGAYHGYKSILSGDFYSVPSFLIAIGVIVFCIAFFGCCGAIKENYCMILTFSFLLICVFILELSAGIAGYILRNEASGKVRDGLNTSMAQYGDKDYMEVTRLWDEIQQQFECCGVDSAQDWIKVKDGVPMSCCQRQVGAIYNETCTPESETVFKTGCGTAFGEYIRAHAVSLGAVGIALAFIQFAGIFFACYISKQLKERQWYSG